MHISKLVDYVKNEISFSKEFCEDNAFVTLRIEPILKILENLEQSHKDILEYVGKIEKYKYLYKKALDNTIQADRENIQLKKQIDLMAETIRKLAISLANYKGSYNKETINFTGNIKDIKQYFERKARDGRD